MQASVRNRRQIINWLKMPHRRWRYNQKLRFILLGLLCWPMLTQAQPAAPIQGAIGSPAASIPNQPNVNVVTDCNRRSDPSLTDHGPISVTVNAATAWQPRGGEVLIAIMGDPIKFVGLNYRACFSWNTQLAKDYFSAESLGKARWSEGFVLVRPSDQTGLINVGVTIPPLETTPTGLFDRWKSGARSTGLGFVPVVDMRLIAYTKDGVLFDEVRPIGITSVSFALVITLATLITAALILHRFAGASKIQKLNLPALISGDWILNLVQAPDGRASLAAFQILLWTLVVAASSFYVMILSGNLINVTPGTLTLLGIAGASGLIAAAVPPNPAPGGLSVPQWSDLVRVDKNGLPDISRIQMLFFTVVSAAFVILQVLNSYVIPDIPIGYQILIGISNGVYVGRKFAP